MDFDRDGAERISHALSAAELALLADLARRHEEMGAGIRLKGDPILSALLDAGGTMHRIAQHHLGDAARPVRAILFDKRPGINWALGWHQDRTIAVRERRDAPGFGPWSRKAGIDHVEPPFEIIERMVTLRAHLDDCSEDNAPLLIVPGSHRLGRVPFNQVETVSAASSVFACVAEAGDVWAYASAILHASNAAAKPGHRRVLHVDYATMDLPDGLEWLGIG